MAYGIKDDVLNLLFRIPQDMQCLRNQAIETAIASFASAGIVLVKKDVLGLDDMAASDQGYWDLLFENYLLRDNFRLNT